MGWNFGSIGLDLAMFVFLGKKLKWTHFSSWLIIFSSEKKKLKIRKVK
jgi:hypothetical protein